MLTELYFSVWFWRSLSHVVVFGCVLIESCLVGVLSGSYFSVWSGFSMSHVLVFC